ncbi:hypothetical protein Ae201684P_000017 [Aphanomyces euteiches]|nr:hypothetical protein Ae201684P_000017 [Aphanomyces euteiches]
MMCFHYESGLNPRLASNNGKFYLIKISRLCRECIVTDFDDHFPYDADSTWRLPSGIDLSILGESRIETYPRSFLALDFQTAPINGLSSPVFFSLLAKSISETGGAIWTEQDKSEPACFALSSDGKTISLAKRGLYMVQLNGTMYEDDEGDGVRLLVNGKTISTATPKYIGWLYYVEISRLVTVSKPIDLTVQCCGKAIKDNYTLEVLLLQEFSN